MDTIVLVSIITLGGAMESRPITSVIQQPSMELCRSRLTDTVNAAEVNILFIDCTKLWKAQDVPG